MKLEDRIITLEHDINGNGKPGMKKDIENIRVDAAATKTKVNHLLWLNGSILLVILSGLGGLLFAIAKQAIRIG